MHVTRHLRIVGRLALVAIVLGTGGVARAQPEVWTGSAGDDDWTNGANWLDGSAPVGSVGVQIIFGPDLMGRHTVNGADTPFTDIAGIAFTLADGAYTITGTGSFSFDQGTGIVNDSLFEQTINVALIGTGTGMVLDAQSQNIVLDSFDTGLTIDLSDGAGVLLTVTGGQDTTINNQIIGIGGALAKTGNGTLTLNGANSYDGPTSLFAGTVIAGNNAAFGGGNLIVSGDASLESNDNMRNIANHGSIGFSLTVQGTFDLELSGDYTGAGSLTKVGSGTLLLSGTNSYNGTTFIDEGVLRVDNGDALGDTAGVNLSNKIGTELELLADETIGGLDGGGDTGGNVNLNGNTLTVDQQGASIFEGVIFGTGTLEMSGGGELLLTGANTYAGGTLFSGEGVLGLGNDDALGGGDLTISNEGNLRPFDGFRTIGNDIIVTAGRLGVDGSDGVDFTGNVDLSGLDTNFKIANEAGVEFSGVIANGSLEKKGAGTLTLSGSNIYTGDTTVSEGELILSGSIAGDAIVRSGLLSGGGTVGGDLSVRSGGTVSPGNNIGTLRVDGDYEQRKDATLAIKLNAGDGRTDLLRVKGSARLDRASMIELTIGSARFISAGDTFTIIRADGGVTDKGAEINTLSETLKFIIVRSSSFDNGDRDYILEAIRDPNAFQDAALTPNNRAIGASLDTVVPIADANPDAAAGLIGQLDTLDSLSYNRALLELSPERYNAVTTAEMETTREYVNLQEEYLSARRAGTQTVARMAGIEASRMVSAIDDDAILATALSMQDEAELQSIETDQDLGVWIRGFGVFTDEDSRQERTGFDADTYGGQIGGDLAIGRDTFLGVAAGYYTTEGDFDASLGSFDVDTWRVGPYVTHGIDGWFFDGSLSYGSSDYDVDRDMDTLGRRASGDYDGYDIATAGSVGYDWQFNNDWRLSPSLALQYTYFDYDGFTESGSPGADLVLRDRDTDSLRSRLGLNLAYETIKGGGFNVIVGWQEEWLDNDDISARFAVGGDPFSVSTGDREDTTYFVGVGGTITFKKRGLAYVRYQGNFGDDVDTHGLAGGVSFRF